MPTDQQRHVVLVVPEDVDVHVVVMKVRLGHRVDAHLAQELLDEVRRRVRLFLEVSMSTSGVDRPDADDGFVRPDA